MKTKNLDQVVELFGTNVLEVPKAKRTSQYVLVEYGSHASDRRPVEELWRS